jgi:hypothetical protein
MGLHKQYPKSKDARKRLHRYHDSRDFDFTCRSHGSCAYCMEGRQHNTQKRKAAANDRLRGDL